MFKAIRIGVLLLILFFVSVSTWLTQARSTDWNNSLWVKIYPVNGDGSQAAADYIAGLDIEIFSPIEEFLARETGKFGHSISRPVRMELGKEIREQPPALGDSPGMASVMWWSLKMRWWASGVTDAQDKPDPDVRIFVRYHEPGDNLVLENSVGLQKGMVGIVNAFASRRHAGANNVIIAHEFLHTLGATDKYDPSTGLPSFPLGYAEPDREPKHPQRFAEIMGGRIPLADDDAVIPKSLRYVMIGALTAEEIHLTR
jgi:hypothetical protein